MPPDKVTDARFLADRFDIPAARAAALVSASEREAEALTARLLAEDHRRDVLEGAPVPLPAPDHATDNDEERLKPVRRTPNKRVGAG